MDYFPGHPLLSNLVMMTSFFTAFILECIWAYEDYSINEMGWRRKLVNNHTESPPLQGTNVQVNVHNHNHFNLTLAVTLPIGVAILSGLGWAIYKIRNRRPIPQAEEAEVVAEEAEVVADNPPTQEAEDAVAVTLNVTAQ